MYILPSYTDTTLYLIYNLNRSPLHQDTINGQTEPRDSGDCKSSLANQNRMSQTLVETTTPMACISVDVPVFYRGIPYNCLRLEKAAPKIISNQPRA